jgi:hypothetical protein
MAVPPLVPTTVPPGSRSHRRRFRASQEAFAYPLKQSGSSPGYDRLTIAAKEPPQHARAAGEVWCVSDDVLTVESPDTGSQNPDRKGGVR